jgi:hypothetical protein
MIPSLETIFNEFCGYLEGKIKWSGKEQTFRKEITSIVFNFFDETLSKKEGLIKTSPYMLVDAIWRYPKPESTDECIQISLEHEISKRKISIFLNEEIQRLIDIKASNKIGIFYPSSEPDEKELREGIEMKLNASKYLANNGEKYLFIFGKPTKQRGESIILFKAFLYSYDFLNYGNFKAEILPEKYIKQKV